MSNEQPPEVSCKTSDSTDFAVIMLDAQRMMTAIKIFVKDYPNNQHLLRQVVAANIMLKRVETLNQLNYVCAQLRDLLAMFNDKEMDYEQCISDFAQSERRIGVRYSDTVRDRRGDMDNPNVGPPSIPIQEVATEYYDRHVGDWYRHAARVAGSLPKRKGRKSRAKSKRVVPGSHVYVAEVPKKSLT